MLISFESCLEELQKIALSQASSLSRHGVPKSRKGSMPINVGKLIHKGHEKSAAGVGEGIGKVVGGLGDVAGGALKAGRQVGILTVPHALAAGVGVAGTLGALKLKRDFDTWRQMRRYNQQQGGYY